MDFTDEKLKELKEAYDLYDKDKDNYVGMTELRNIMLCLGLECTSYDDINEIMSEYGEEKEDKSLKRISYPNFLAMISKRSKESDIEDEILHAFKSFDKTGEGKLGLKELHYLMLNLGENFSDEEIQEMIIQTDTTGKGYIDYKDFVKLLLTK